MLDSRRIERTTHELIGIVRSDRITTTLSCSSCMTQALVLETPHKADAKARVERKPRCGTPNVFLRFLREKPFQVAVNDDEEIGYLAAIDLSFDITACGDENEVRGLCCCARCRAQISCLAVFVMMSEHKVSLPTCSSNPISIVAWPCYIRYTRIFVLPQTQKMKNDFSVN